MKKLVSWVLAFLCLTVNLPATELTVERGTVFRLLPPAEMDFDRLGYGKKLIFTVAQDVVVGGRTVAAKGDPVEGEVIYGFGRTMGGISDMAIVQFAYFEKDGVRIPLMKSIQINGKNRQGLVFALALPTLFFSIFFPGGRLDKMKRKPIPVATMSTVKVELP